MDIKQVIGSVVETIIKVAAVFFLFHLFTMWQSKHTTSDSGSLRKKR